MKYRYTGKTMSTTSGKIIKKGMIFESNEGFCMMPTDEGVWKASKELTHRDFSVLATLDVLENYFEEVEE